MAKSIKRWLTSVRSLLRKPKGQDKGPSDRELDQLEKEATADAMEAHATRLVNRILIEGINRGARQITVEQGRDVLHLSYWVNDSVEEHALHLMENTPTGPLMADEEAQRMGDAVGRRLREMAHVSEEETDSPTSGHFLLKLGRGRMLTVDATVFPSPGGETITLELSGMDVRGDLLH